MYPRSSTRTPVWLVVVGAAVFVFGGFTLYNGVLNFLSGGGNITAPVTATSVSALEQTQQALNQPAPNSGDTIQIPTRLPTRTPIPPCVEFRVIVIKARVRDCPKDTCPTQDSLLSQGAKVCVIGVVPEATEWYQVNLRPDSSFPELAFMHESVLEAVRPTARPTRTPTGERLPTVTPIPTASPTRTYTPLPLVPNRTAPAP
jgi:hypothetical protein